MLHHVREDGKQLLATADKTRATLTTMKSKLASDAKGAKSLQLRASTDIAAASSTLVKLKP